MQHLPPRHPCRADGADGGRAGRFGADHRDSVSVRQRRARRQPPQVGDGVGATIVGDNMYVTSTHALTIFDIKTNPAEPKMLGVVHARRRVRERGGPDQREDPRHLVRHLLRRRRPGRPRRTPAARCLTLYDVTDPENVKLLTSIPDAGDHTSACLLDCTWILGLRGLGHRRCATRRTARSSAATGWTSIAEQGWEQTKSCHHVREIQPGILLGSCQPLILMSVRARGRRLAEQAGRARHRHQRGPPLHPLQPLAARTARTSSCSSAARPTPQPQCADTVVGLHDLGRHEGHQRLGGFLKGVDVLAARRGAAGQRHIPDGHSAYNVLGCSVHWFEEHPTFNNGGLVALAEYENGTRFLQISRGQDRRAGLLPAPRRLDLGAALEPVRPEDRLRVDYTRGVDVLRWKGETYVPNASGQVIPDPTKVPGTGRQDPERRSVRFGGRVQQAPRSRPRAEGGLQGQPPREAPLRASTSSSRLQGRKVDRGNRLVARFKNKKKTFTWNGKDIKGRPPLLRATTSSASSMKTASGVRDTRRATLTGTAAGSATRRTSTSASTVGPSSR